MIDLCNNSANRKAFYLVASKCVNHSFGFVHKCMYHTKISLWVLLHMKSINASKLFTQ